MNVLSDIGSVDTDPGVLAMRGFVTDMVRDEMPDLTMRQLAIMLRVYTTRDPQTVRGLAEALDISKPAVSRAFDTLAMLRLMERRRDPRDRRSVHAVRTQRGTDYARRVRDIFSASSVESP